MKKQYLNLSVYRCDRCAGPVVSGSLSVRENEISKATDIRQMGSFCLSCGYPQDWEDEAGHARRFPPVEWQSAAELQPVSRI